MPRYSGLADAGASKCSLLEEEDCPSRVVRRKGKGSKHRTAGIHARVCAGELG